LADDSTENASRPQRWLRGCAIAACLIALSACSGLGVRPDRKEPRRDDSFEKASQYKQDSDCTRAIPLLEPLAGRGHGFEVAQLRLGQCYLETARNESSPTAAATARKTAADWILKAANSGDPGAQEQAIRLYADGTGVSSDPVEAGKWFLVLERNPMRRVFGPVTMDGDLELSLRQKLNDTGWAEARRRAAQWLPVEQPTTLPPTPEPTRRRSQQ
jgi:hypothetical protein